MKIQTNHSGKLSRRSFISLSAGAVLGASILSLPIPSTTKTLAGNLHKISSNRSGMGTFINIVVLDESTTKAEIAIARSYAEMDRLIPLLSRFDQSSPVHRLNQDGYLNDIPPELLQVLGASLHYNKLTAGTFDITILPILDLIEQEFTTTGLPPSQKALSQLSQTVGSQHIKLTDKSISFNRAEMRISLDSIAKGFIVDRMMDSLRQNGIQHALVNAGGDIAVFGGKAHEKPWAIAIQHPNGKQAPLDVISLHTGAVATSGNYEIFFDEEKVYHHLISPELHKPANKNKSVSVLAPSVMAADALATGIFIMQDQRGAHFLNKHQQLEGLIVNNNDQHIFSHHWQG